jgi:hypothetical protein
MTDSTGPSQDLLAQLHAHQDMLLAMVQQTAALIEHVEILGANGPELVGMAADSVDCPVRIAALISAYARAAHITPATLVGPSQKRRHAWPRQAVMAAAARQGYGLSAIGRALGGRDHSTVKSGIKAHNLRMAHMKGTEAA